MTTADIHDGITVPADEDAETAMLGAMLLSRDAVAVGAEMLLARDFYSTVHAAIYTAIIERYDHGLSADPVGVAATLDETATHVRPERGWKSLLMRIQAETPASANAPHYAAIIMDRSERRRLLAAAADLRARAADLTWALDDIVADGTSALSGTTRAAAARRFPNYDDWSDTVDMTEAWLVPGVLERRERIIVVAAEGAGKSLWLRQCAAQLAAGVHWFSLRRIAPQRVLIIDVENSPRQIVRQTELRIRSMIARLVNGWDPDNLTIIPYSSLDLNARHDRLDVESYIAGHRPAALFIGPLYKIFQSDGRHTMEENATRAQRVIDDWRARYDIAVLMEHHATKAREGGILDPFGSGAWLRWPEYGIALEVTDVAGTYRFRHWRGQREQRNWPSEIMRVGPPGTKWPWMPVQYREDLPEQDTPRTVQPPFRDGTRYDEDAF